MKGLLFTTFVLAFILPVVTAQNADFYSYDQRKKVDGDITFDGTSFSTGPVVAIMFPFKDEVVNSIMDAYEIEAKQNLSSSYDASDLLTVNIKYNGISETHNVSKFYTERLRRTMRLDELVMKFNTDKKYQAFYDMDLEQTLFLNRDHISLLQETNNIEVEILFKDEKIGSATLSVKVEEINPFDKNAFNIPEPNTGLGSDKNAELVDFVKKYRKDFQEKSGYEYIAFYILSDDWIVYKKNDEVQYKYIYTLELKKYPDNLYGYSTTRVVKDYKGNDNFSNEMRVMEGWGRFGYLPKMAIDIIINRYAAVGD